MLSIRKLATLAAIGLCTATMSLPANADTGEKSCNVNVDTDKGDGGTQVKICKDKAEVGFSGPIRDVDIAHPVGKGDAFIPKAGRDIERGVQEVNKVIRRIFNW